MRTILLFVAAVCVAFGQAASKKEVAGDKPAVKAFSRETQIEIKLIAAQEEAAQSALHRISDLLLAPIEQAKGALIARVCGEIGIDVKDCVIDSEKGTVSKRVDPVSAPTSPAEVKK